MKFLLRAAAFTLVFFVNSVCQADFFYDGMDYQLGSQLVQQSGGTGFATSWIADGFNISSSNFVGEAAGLAYENLLVSGGSVAAPFGATLNGISRTPVLGGFPAGTRYLSFLIRRNNTLGIFNGFGGLYVDGSLGDVFIGKPGANDFWSIEERGGTGVQATNVAATVNETTLLVLKIETLPNNGSLDTFSFFVNPVVGAEEPTPNVVKNDLDIGVWNSIVLYNSGAYSFDELRIGDTFAAVMPAINAVPEPIFLATAGVGLVFLRRRLTAFRCRSR